MPAPIDGGDWSVPLLKLVGKSSADQLRKHLQVETVGELLSLFPRRYLRRGELSSLRELPHHEEVTLVARVVNMRVRPMRQRRGSITEVTVTDESAGGTLTIGFFNGWRAERELKAGAYAMFSGKVGVFRGALTLTNPDYMLLDEEQHVDAQALARQPIPIYPATARLPSWKIAQAIGAVLPAVDLDALADPLPEHLVEREGFFAFGESYRRIHCPQTAEDWHRARDRFRYQEALVLQTSLARRRWEIRDMRTQPRSGRPGGMLEAFDASLPFTRTDGQQRVGGTLERELAASRPMRRLLQGDVGSGKTIVALRAMLQVVDSGGQAVLLAPTEVLASQHHHSVTQLLGPLAQRGMLGGDERGTRVVLFTGSLGMAQKKRVLLDIASGEAGIVIGTHALFAEHVSFADLGLVVIDEQHRFGVEQRARLGTKAEDPPHLLVMTATPIPRTVAMTVFGDLEISILDELPASRTPVSTFVVGLTENPAWEQRIWQRMREEIDAGHRIYLVCPRIGDGAEECDDDRPNGDMPQRAESETRQTMSVHEMEQKIRKTSVLAAAQVDLLHGRLEAEEKRRIMAGFASGAIDLVISTTVVEVGVDVPEATLMVVWNAECFGIAQLHQLRGRVGRGSLPGTALFVTEEEATHPSRARLDIVAGTTDGFALAREDLALRREGDVLGKHQSGGKSALQFLRLLEHGQVIDRAREDAERIIVEDPQLVHHGALAALLDVSLDAEQAEFLERA